MQRHVILHSLSRFLPLLLLFGCAATPPTVSKAHIEAPSPRRDDIPKTVNVPTLPPKPQVGSAAKQARYSVVVTQVPVRDLLFALARDAKINVDIHPAIEGVVTLNAINQTMPQILSRISRQVDMRYEVEGGNLIVVPDTAYLKTYKIDYVNMTRSTSSQVTISTSIAGLGGSAASTSTGGESSTGGNMSSSTLTNASDNNFWKTLALNLHDLLQEKDKLLVVRVVEPTSKKGNEKTDTKTDLTSTDKTDEKDEKPAGSISETKEANHVIINPETGIITVRATSRQHLKVAEFIDRIQASAQRQVMIEATIVEVTLSNDFQSGVDWSRLVSGRAGVSTKLALLGTDALTKTPLAAMTLTDGDSAQGALTVTIRALEAFGKTRVLSSPKLLALNNQTALLKVVDEKVYFTVEKEESSSGTGADKVTEVKYSSKLHTVPVGVVMSVTPQISDSDQVTLNVRPTISRIIGYKDDPVPQLLNNPNYRNLIPEIQIRELESVMKVANGQTAVLGGLMQDSVNNTQDGVPVLGKIPFFGSLFSSKAEVSSKTELIIFLRPIVVRSADVNGDLSEFKTYLPDDQFFHNPEDEKFGAVKFLDGTKKESAP